MKLRRFLADHRPPTVWQWAERLAWRDGFFTGFPMGVAFAGFLCCLEWKFHGVEAWLALISKAVGR